VGNPLLVVAVLFSVLAVVLLIRREIAGADPSALGPRIEALEKAQERVERAVRDEVARSREELAVAAREQRTELGESFRIFGDSVAHRIAELAAVQAGRLEEMSATVGRLSETNERKLEAVRTTVEGRLQALQADNAQHLETIRQTVD